MDRPSILLIDDSEFDRTLLRKYLEKEGPFRVREATSVEDAREWLSRESYDLVLIDILMPGSHGTELLFELRQKFGPAELPILMVTAKSDFTDVTGCLEAGANDYLQKPVHLPVAMARIRTQLRLAEMTRYNQKWGEIRALDNMIATYNHEINNPLAVALGCLDRYKVGRDLAQVEKAQQALWRMADIVRQIAEIHEKKVNEEKRTQLPAIYRKLP